MLIYSEADPKSKTYLREWGQPRPPPPTPDHPHHLLLQFFCHDGLESKVM